MQTRKARRRVPTYHGFPRSVAVVFLLASLVTCRGQESAIVTSVSGRYWHTRGDETLGCAIVTGQAMDVTALGFYDSEGNGLRLAHSVGLWDAAGFSLGRVEISPENSAFAREGLYIKDCRYP
jgi:hypothetical protein